MHNIFLAIFQTEYFTYLKCYLIFRDFPLQVTLKTCMGQALDMLACSTKEKEQLETFTMERYNALAKYKGSYISTYLPVVLAMYMVSFSCYLYSDI
jgi:hypothetical protein